MCALMRDIREKLVSNVLFFFGTLLWSNTIVERSLSNVNAGNVTAHLCSITGLKPFKLQWCGL